MDKKASLVLILGGIFILSGCAGTASNFECNATTSDSCMTIEQANDKAKRLEEGDTLKPDAVALLRLAEGNFRTASAQPLTTSMVSAATTGSASRETKGGSSSSIQVSSAQASTPPVRSASFQLSAVQISTREMIVDPRPLRVVEKTAGLWIAPYIDKQDVYHQPTRVFFVVKPSAWGTPRVN